MRTDHTAAPSRSFQKSSLCEQDAVASIKDLGPHAERVVCFYSLLADLAGPDPLEPIVDRLLELLVVITGARTAYVEASTGEDGLFKCVYPRDELDPDVRSISRGIVRRATEERRTISTSDALGDDRFADLESVRQNEIRSVLCAPVNVQGQIGVVYLQGVSELTAFHRELAEGFARKLGRRLAWPLTLSKRTTMDEAAGAFKRWFALEVLEQTGWKGTTTAGILAISRSTLYGLVRDLRSRRRLSVE